MSLLELSAVHAHYGHAHVLHGISLSVHTGEVVALLGRNGAGKSTTLKAIIGWVTLSSGTVQFDGKIIQGISADRIARSGIGFVPEDRRIFPTLTVEENLRMGFFQNTRRSSAGNTRMLHQLFQKFPRLGERKRQLGKTLSGGEQQMLAIARALAGEPRMLLIDEPSEGLAPLLVDAIFASITQMKQDGMSVLLVEQNVRRALEISDRAYVIEKGKTIAEGPANRILSDDALRQKLSV
jgi:branched-chain amino acid transport system ATP-binding protein